MRKILTLAIIGMSLLMASCSSDEATVVAPVNPDGTVSFTVNMPSTGLSRGANSIADGLATDYLHYVVYQVNADNTTTFLFADGQAAFGGSLSATVNIPLVNGVKYRVAFFAKKNGAPYTIDQATGNLKVDYSAVEANNDDLDAFYGVAEDIVVGTDTPSTTYLYRPFAQVNVGASDWLTAKNAGVTVANTAMHFTAEAYTEMDMATGDVVGTPTEVTFTQAAYPQIVATATPDFLSAAGTTDVYYWMGMNYLLVPKDDSTVNTMTFSFDGVTAPQNSVEVNSLPVKRNYRTNVIGKFFTTAADFEVEIIPGFVGSEEVTYFSGTNATAAINNLKPGQTLSLTGEEVTVDPAEASFPTGSSLVGKGPELTTLIVDVADTKDGLKIDNGGVTIGDMTVDATGIGYVGGYHSAINISADDCEVKDCHVKGGGTSTNSASILVQKLKEGESVHFTNVTTTGGFRGIMADRQNGDIYVDGCVLKPLCYPINVNGGGNFGLYVTNTTLSGWTSYAEITKGAHFTNCIFETSAAPYVYNYLRPYADTELIDCTFRSGFSIGAGTKNKVLVVKNCNFDGVKITANNFIEQLINTNASDYNNIKTWTVTVDGVAVVFQ